MTPEAVELTIQIVCNVVGGLGIFLFGMKNMSDGMQAIAGDRLRTLIGSVTNNRFIGCSIGTLITCIVQSSSVTTVMVVGFVNSGFMTLMQAIGVVLGANIGTTITGWILVLKIGKYGLPMLGVAALVYLFARKDRLKYAAMTIMGIGMIFFGLEIMSSGFKPLRTMPEFVQWFGQFHATTYPGVLKCALIGCVLTMIVQSSSATLGITIGLAETGMISFPTAAALVLGENIGTTITAQLAAIGGNTNAKRTAHAHMLFNVIGVFWITAIFQPYMRLVAWTVGVDPGAMVLADAGQTFPHMRSGIAITHTAFNVLNTAIFMPLLPLLARVVTRMVPDKSRKEVPHLAYPDVGMLQTPAIGIEESRNEILKMGEHVQKMLVWLKDIMTAKTVDDEKVKKVFHREEVMDMIQKEVTEFLGALLTGNVAADVVQDARIQLRMADEYESISDYIAGLLKLHLKRHKSDIEFSLAGKGELMALHVKVQDYVDLVSAAVRDNQPEVLTKARALGDAITHDMKESRDEHLSRLGTEQATPLTSLIFTDMLNSYRRVKDHALNIAEAVAGEK